MKRASFLALLSFAASGQTSLTVREAVSQALASHPLLVAESGRIAASEGLERQAGLRPNPRFTFQMENLRSWQRPGFEYSRDADTFAYLSQPFETGGKRARRMDVAEANRRRAQLERDLLSRQIANRIKHAYWAAAGAQRLHELLLDTGKNFRQILDYHEVRVREGAMAEADLLRVRVEGERLAMDATSAGLDAERARIQLLREMGRTEFGPVTLADRLEAEPLPVGADAARATDERIEMKIARHAIEQARAHLQLEQAAARPDVEFSVGYKGTAGYHTLLGGFQIPLPFSARNQGNIAAAAAQVKVAESSLAATEALVRAEVAASQAEYDMRRRQLRESLEALRRHASESSRIALAAYREGGADLLRLLDAERTRLGVEILYCRTLAELRQNIVALETAMGVMP